MRPLCLILLIALCSCAQEAPSKSCVVPVHNWTASEQKQMAIDEKSYLPPDSILWPVIQDCALTRAAARQCAGE